MLSWRIGLLSGFVKRIDNDRWTPSFAKAMEGRQIKAEADPVFSVIDWKTFKRRAG
jgi:hypothetical protein